MTSVAIALLLITGVDSSPLPTFLAPTGPITHHWNWTWLPQHIHNQFPPAFPANRQQRA